MGVYIPKVGVVGRFIAHLVAFSAKLRPKPYETSQLTVYLR